MVIIVREIIRRRRRGVLIARPVFVIGIFILRLLQERVSSGMPLVVVGGGPRRRIVVPQRKIERISLKGRLHGKTRRRLRKTIQRKQLRNVGHLIRIRGRKRRTQHLKKIGAVTESHRRHLQLVKVRKPHHLIQRIVGQI